MISPAPQPGRVQRLLRVVALLLVVGAVLTWVTPTNVAGTNLVPYGCGSPASPIGGELAGFVCDARLLNAKLLALALLLGAAAVAALGELGMPLAERYAKNRAAGLGVAGAVALPVLVLAVVVLFMPIADTASNGALLRCGTAVAPARDSISTGLCGETAAERKSLAVGAIVLSLLVMAGGAYVGGPGRHDDGSTVNDLPTSEGS